FTYAGGAIFPLVGDSLSGLGYEYAVRWGWGVAGRAWSGWTRYFQNLCQAKTAILGELCSQNRASAIDTLV
ncbi:MAG: hypothetical protein WC627_12490, partial [Legionella sp.]